MSWDSVYPILTDDHFLDYSSSHAIGRLSFDQIGIEEDCTFGPVTGTHIVSTSMYLPNVSDSEIEIISNDCSPCLGKLSSNFDNIGDRARFFGSHFSMIRLARKAYPEITFRVYLDPKMSFLIEELLSEGAQVVLMKTSSSRHNPGSLWRFLALQESCWSTIVRSDRGADILADIERTKLIMPSGLKFWRTPSQRSSSSLSPATYLPISATQLGGYGGIPVAELLSCLLAITQNGSFSTSCRLPRNYLISPEDLVIGDAIWPHYGFEEFFLLCAIYPRVAAAGMLTLCPVASPTFSCWFGLDIEYATWANSASQLLLCKPYTPKMQMRFERMKTMKWALK